MGAINVYNDYAETNLEDDQPTDYSVKYQEQMDPLEDTVKTYCTKGTPFVFSSASSITDLRDLSFSKDLSESSSPTKLIDVCWKFPSNAKKEITHPGKSVTFNAGVSYVEDTPLMFSRSSSLTSLGSCDQQSFHDDGSLISDFSCVTSGAISPSDLPNSPSEPITPPRRKNVSYNGNKDVDDHPSEIVHENLQDGVFKEETKQYAMEGTPLDFSCATSFSSLTASIEFGETYAKSAKK